MICSINTFDYSMIRNIDQVRRKGKRSARYLDVVTAFDIETTTIESLKQAFMYIWQFQISDITVIGRTWSEFRALIEGIQQYIDEGVYLVCYVHNLSYEYQFIKSIIHIDEVFAMDKRKVLYCRSGRIEFRCSYLLSNMNLDQFVRNAGGKYRKQTGYDYRKIRYPWTDMSEEEIRYCIYDVKALTSAIENKLKMDHDDLSSIPLTSTGYVRRIFKEVMQPYRRMVRHELPDLDVFQGLRKAFRGGNTHANRHNVNRILQDVYSYDISSSYPSVLISERYPGRFEPADPDRIPDLLDRGRALLMNINMYDVELHDDAWGCPYISKAKCGYVRGGVFDNGRVLVASEIRDIWITEVDLQILTDEYEFSYEVIKVYSAVKKKLPPAFRSELMKLYRSKTELKGIDDYLYSKTKNQFNSAYGMSVQNPCRPEWILEEGEIVLDDSKSMQDMIDRYHMVGWLPYQIGVWCTCYARQKLEAGLKAIDPDAFVYADTDSIKLIGCADDIFRRLNKNFRNRKHSAKDPDGKIHFLGIFERDDHYTRFVTMGAKKYAYEDDEGKLHVTISGVNKKAGAEELQKLENFREGFVFRSAGGLEAVYNDDTDMIIRRDGHDLRITSNIALVPSTYTLGVAPDYRELLNFLNNTDIRYSLHYER